MKLKFKQQQYQDDAVNSIVSCFAGEIKDTRKSLFNRYNKISDKGTLFEKEETVEVISFGNHPITLTDDERRKNIRVVQRKNDINLTDDASLDDFSVEMETGTGKTFTYIKSMYELNKEYGWSKFIVMTPSIAIREGVLKTFQITEDYFQEKYKKKIRFFIYNSSNSSNIANISSFAADDSIWVMIINYQAFNSSKNQNVIDRELDELQSNKPIDVIKSVRPILIIDEPQKFGDRTEEMFSKFNPLFKIRYSATHKKGKEYNKIYRLDAIDAFNQKLVKKINVKGIEILNDKSEGTYLFLDHVDISQKKDPVATVEMEVKTSSGVKKVLKKIHNGDDLFTISGELAPYKGFKVVEIDARFEEYDTVEFTNGVVISSGQAIGNVDDDYIVRIQIRETIKSHLEKEKELYNKGIKVLSLFFIDKVANYKQYDDNNNILKGEYAKIFEEEYINAINEYINIFDDDYSKYLKKYTATQVHNGYFSIDKKGHAIDSKIKDKSEYISDDEDAYDLIMKDKERLLSLSEPVRFIFSHSALREGWDNPNIFQICTLKHSNSEISKRQEIGRGLRIAVNNNGERMDSSVLEENFHRVNTLTVIASESYDSFAKALQKDMAETITSRPKNFIQEYFVGKELINDNGDKYTFTQEKFMDLAFFNVEKGYVDRKNDYKVTDKFIEDMENNVVEVMPELENFKNEFCNLMKKMYLTNNTEFITDERRKNIRTLLPNENFNKTEFQELWNKINYQTIYEVKFNSDELIQKAINAIDAHLNVNRMKVRITEGIQKDKIDAVSVNSGNSMTEMSSNTINAEEVYTPSENLYDLIGEITKDTGLTRHTIIEILSGISPSKFDMYKYNPEEFIRKTINIINAEKATTVIEGIKYHKIDQKYEDSIFTINVDAELGENAIEVKKHIYDYLVTDSKNEINFAKKLETGEATVYAKLPSGFKIPTPLGNYNPDWAIVFDNKDFKYVYFIAETKGSMDTLQLRGSEEAKIECARRHFALLSDDKVKYDVVDSYESLINLLTA